MKVRIGPNPEFATITGLTNRNFNPASITEGKMVTEEQLLEVYERIIADEAKADACCRDIIFWEARTQVVRLNTNAVAISQGIPRTTAGGRVISSWDENINFGATRKGLPYTVTFPLKWNDDLYVRRHTSANRTYGANANGSGGTNTCGIIPNTDMYYENFVAYMYAEDNVIKPTFCDITSSNRSGFMMSGNADMVTTTRYGVKRCNLCKADNFPNATWHWFEHDIKEDGTVTIHDPRRSTLFSIIRYYTQWTLNECADGSLLSDTFGAAQEAYLQNQQ